MGIFRNPSQKSQGGGKRHTILKDGFCASYQYRLAFLLAAVIIVHANSRNLPVENEVMRKAGIDYH